MEISTSFDTLSQVSSANRMQKNNSSYRMADNASNAGDTLRSRGGGREQREERLQSLRSTLRSLRSLQADGAGDTSTLESHSTLRHNPGMGPGSTATVTSGGPARSAGRRSVVSSQLGRQNSRSNRSRGWAREKLRRRTRACMKAFPYRLHSQPSVASSVAPPVPIDIIAAVQEVVGNGGYGAATWSNPTTIQPPSSAASSRQSLITT